MDPATITLIIEWVIELTTVAIQAAIEERQFQKASEDMASLIQQQQETRETIISLIHQQHIDGASQQIMNWTVQLKEKLGVASNGDSSELSQFINDIRNANNGVHFVLNKLYDGLVGRNTGFGASGKAVDDWHRSEYRHLDDNKNVDYTIRSYVDAMNTKLVAALHLICNGLVLLTITTKDKKQAVAWSQEWEKNMKDLIKAVYDNYPPALKLFKPAYESDWQTQVWYYLQDVDNTSRYLYYSDGFFTGGVHCGNESGDESRWRFDPAVSDGLAGLLSWSKKRLKVDTHVTHSNWPVPYLIESLDEGSDVVYKMVPLIGVDRPIIRMVGPFKESDKSPFSIDSDASRLKVPNHNWVLTCVKLT